MNAQRRIVQIFQKSLQKSNIRRGSKLFQLIKRAQNYVTNNKPQSLMKVNQRSVNTVMASVVNKTQNTQFRDHVIHGSQSQNQTINAYSTSVHNHGLAGFVEMDNMPWFKVSWDDLPKSEHSKTNSVKNELLSIYVLLQLYSQKMTGKKVHIYCDNFAVINLLNTAKSETNLKETDSDLRTLVNKVSSICADHSIDAQWLRIVGVPQISADRLARDIDDPFQYSQFRPQSKPTDLTEFEQLRNVFNA